MTTRNYEMSDKDVEAITDMLINIKKIGKNLRKVEAILKELPKSFKLPADAPAPTNNVFFIDRSILVEYDKIAGTPMTKPNLIALYAKWSEKNLEAFEANKDNFWNKSLFDSLMKNHSIVSSIRLVLSQNNMGKLDWKGLLDND